MHTAVCLMISIMFCDVMIFVFRLKNTTDRPPVSRTKTKCCNSLAYNISGADVITYNNNQQSSVVSRSIESLPRRRYTRQLHDECEQSRDDLKLTSIPDEKTYFHSRVLADIIMSNKCFKNRFGFLSFVFFRSC